MKPQSLHAHEDRLLDFAYGELPPHEAQAVRSHLDGCARCSELLAGMSGVRTTMAQLPVEPAPDAGLESLLAYAQQAARNAAAGPAPKPTWWRRWLMPVMGVAAVCAFGVISVTVNKNLDLKEEVAAQKSAEAAAPAAPVASASPAPAPSPEESYPEPEAPRAPVALPPAAMRKVAPQAQRVPPTPVSEPTGALGVAREQEAARGAPLGMTPPPPAPAAKLDSSSLAKEAPAKKPFVAGTKGSRSEWSNVGTGLGFGESKDAAGGAYDEGGTYEKAPAAKKAKNSYEYDRRDAMTQSGAFSKPKPILVAPPQAGAVAEASPAQPSTPAPAQAPMMDEEPTADGLMAGYEAEVQQQAPSRSALRVGGGRRSDTAPSKSADSASGDDFDDLSGSKAGTAKQERSASSAPPPPPPAASAAPMPSISTEKPLPPPKSVARAEPRDESAEPSPAELSKKAQAALRSGNRVLEVQLLRQALAAGATGTERLGLLNRLCEAEFAIGQRQAALQACSQVLEEDPRSSAAQMARNRLRKEGLEADEARPGTGSRGAVKAAPADKRMSAPDSAPTQRQ
jgi:hypothetical protein